MSVPPVSFARRCVSLLPICCVSSLSVLSTEASVDCSHYEVKELKAICSGNKAAVTVHSDLSATGLNAEVDSWGDNPGLHILPPMAFSLSEPIKIKKGQSLLPHPTSPLPEGKSLRTIELTSGKNFRADARLLTVLQLDSNTAVGGVEIHAESMHSELSDHNGTKTLVYAPANLNVTFNGNVLTGSHHLDYLFWNDISNGNY